MIKLLDIKADEKKKVVNLFLQNFFDGLGTSFFYAMGIFIFLGNSTHHDALHYYPLVFVVGGLLILLVGRIYAKIETKARTDYLIYGLGIFVILLVISSYPLLKVKINVFTGIALLIIFQLIYYLRQTQFWGLSSLSFNVLQSKRLFSIISAGDLPAKFLGYTLVFKLLESGTILPEHLIYFVVISYLISFFFLRKVFISDHHLKHSSHQHFRSGVKEIKFFGNHLIRAMAIMAFFIMFVVFIVDYSFTKVVMHKINNEDADMYFLVSTILYTSYGIASILKLFFSGRVFQYLGLRWTIILTPVLMLIMIFSVLIIIPTTTDPNWHFVRLFIFLYIGFIIFRDVIGKPVFLTLFQPLSKKMRLHGHNIVKGVAEPLGMIISGSLLLIYYNYFEDYRLELFAIALIIPLLLWLLSATNVRRMYFLMLQNVIKLRLLSGKQYLLIDAKTNEKLIEKLDADDETEVLFALDHIKNYDLSNEKVIPLFKHKSEFVQKAAWEVLADTNTAEQFGDLILKHFNSESSLDLKKTVYFRLAKSADKVQDIYAHLSDKDPLIIEYILLGWTVTKTFELPEKVKGIVKNYLESTTPEKYQTGLRLQKIIPSNIGKAYITKSLESANTEQRRSAIIGSFGFLEPQFFNRIINLLHEPAMSRIVKNELILLGDQGIEYYIPLLKDADDLNTFRLIQIMGLIGSKKVIKELVTLLKFKNPDIRKAILNTLFKLGHERLKPFEKEITNEYFKEIETAKKILSVYDCNSREFESLCTELEDLTRRIFQILSLLQDPENIKRIEEGIFSKSSDHIANSIEVLNQTLKPELCMLFKPLIEGVTNPPKNVQTKQNSSILLEDHATFNKWTVANLLAQFGCEDKEITRSLKERNTAIIDEQIRPKKMKTSDALRIMEKVIVLRKTSLFGNTPENILVEVAGLLKEERFEPGSTIFNKGEKGDCMYIIYSGKVKIHDNKSELAVFGQHDFFGDLAMLDTEPRSATATAEIESILLRLDQDAIYELMNDRIEIAQSIIKTLCTRIRNLNIKYTEIENK